MTADWRDTAMYEINPMCSRQGADCGSESSSKQGVNYSPSSPHVASLHSSPMPHEALSALSIGTGHAEHRVSAVLGSSYASHVDSDTGYRPSKMEKQIQGEDVSASSRRASCLTKEATEKRKRHERSTGTPAPRTQCGDRHC